MFMPYEITAMECNAKKLGIEFEYCSELGPDEFRPIGEPHVRKFAIGRQNPGEMILFLMTMLSITNSRWKSWLSLIPGVRHLVLYATARQVRKLLL